MFCGPMARSGDIWLYAQGCVRLANFWPMYPLGLYVLYAFCFYVIL